MSLHFDFDLNKALAKAKQGIKSNDISDYAKVAFLPEGKHKLRFFHDPDGDIFRYVMLHQLPGKKTHCPNYLREIDPVGCKDLPVCEICELAVKVDNWRSKLPRRYSCMIYGHLYDTNAASDYWQVGNTYVIVGKAKMRDSVLSFLEGLAADALDYITMMLNPKSNGGICNVDVTGGTQGQIQVSAIPGVVKGPVDLGDWYKPLNEVWIPAKFDLASYMEVLAAAKVIAEEALANKPSEPSEPSEGSPSVTPVQETQSASDVIPETKPVQETPSVLEQSTVSDPIPSSNSIKTLTGKVVELLPHIIERNCWTKFDQSDKVCLNCSLQMECMFDQTLGGKK